MMKASVIILCFGFGLPLLSLLVTGQQNGTNCSTMCFHLMKPFCGSDGQTYGNACYMNQANCMNNTNVQYVSDGACNSTLTSTTDSSSSTDSTTVPSTDSTTVPSTDPTKDTTTDSSMNSTTVPTRVS